MDNPFATIHNVAKRLKEHGFPQNGSGFALPVRNGIIYNGEILPWLMYLNSGGVVDLENYLYIPTLAELIKACEMMTLFDDGSSCVTHGFASLDRTDDGYRATGIFLDSDGSQRMETFDDETPEYAMCKLYIALHPI